MCKAASITSIIRWMLICLTFKWKEHFKILDLFAAEAVFWFFDLIYIAVEKTAHLIRPVHCSGKYFESSSFLLRQYFIIFELQRPHTADATW